MKRIFSKKVILIVVLVVLVILIIGIISGNSNKNKVTDINISANTDVSDSTNNVSQTSQLKSFTKGNFGVSYPANWNRAFGQGKETIFMVTGEACAIAVNKYDALPKDLVNSIIGSVEDQGKEVLYNKESGGIYEISYTLPGTEQNLVANSKILYCDNQSYAPTVVCPVSYDVDKLQQLKNQVLGSAYCKAGTATSALTAPETAITPASQVVASPAPETKTSSSIVKTNAGDEFGINLGYVVDFFNGEVILRKIMSDFQRVNLVFEDKANSRNLKLKAEISGGKIMLLDDGGYSGPDVTISMPLADAINIFNNVANLTPAKVISFAINLRTDPANIKNEIIGKFLRGEYN